MIEITPPQFDPTLLSGTNHDLIDSYLTQLKNSATIALNLGCGEHLKSGYINCDMFNAKADFHVDIRNVSTKIKSADLIESHHALEHLSHADAVSALHDWASLLNCGGYMVISLPDLEACMHKFLMSSEKERWGSVINMIYGSQEHEGMFHKTGFTPQRLKDILSGIGIECILLVEGYPLRPTPSFLYVGRKL